MVLKSLENIHRKKIRYFIFLFVLLNFRIYAIEFHISYQIEALQQSPYEAYRKTLSVIKEDIKIKLIDSEISDFSSRYSYISDTEYTIKNIGTAVVQTVGITSYGYSESDPPNSITFFVNGKKHNPKIFPVPHDSNIPNKVQYWFFIDVYFEENRETNIKVVYTNRYATFGMERKCIFYGNLDSLNIEDWYANTQMTLLLENQSEKYSWIGNIYFDDKEGDSLSFNKIIVNEDTLNTSYFDILINNTTSKLTFKNSYRPQVLTILILHMHEWYSSQYFDAYNQGIVLLYSPIGKILEKDILKNYELALLTPCQLRILRNAIYAQYGYVFNDNSLQSLFETRPYQNIRNCKSEIFKEELISETEQKNIEIIHKLELLKQRVVIPGTR
ncbi:MAG: YARHG domain-containing protein [Treponema sp.]|jgi:hypothetical protein|nr:YARHG domain-containing protein [Treponema sp.]